MTKVFKYFSLVFTFFPMLFKPTRMEMMLFFSNTFHVKRMLSRNRFIVKKNPWLVKMEEAHKYNIMKHAVPMNSKVIYTPHNVVPVTKQLEEESELEMARR